MWDALTPWQRECLADWVHHGQNVNEEIRHSFSGEPRFSSTNEDIHNAMQAASRLVVPGQAVWRGSAWPLVPHSWHSEEYVCCSAEREIAQGFVRTPAWPWPEQLAVDDLDAVPATACITIGRGVRAVVLTDLLERADNMWRMPDNSEREIVLLPCLLTVTGIDDDRTVQVLAGKPFAQVRAAA